MFRSMLVLVVGLMIPGPAAAGTSQADVAAQSAARGESRDGWPDTWAGAVGREWVEAFSTSEEAMRVFLKKRMAPESLAERKVPKRIENYRKLRERFGALVLGSVVKSSPEKLQVSLLAEDATVHQFVFTVEKAAPPPIGLGRDARAARGPRRRLPPLIGSGRAFR